MIEAMRLTWANIPDIFAWAGEGHRGHYNATSKLDGIEIATWEGTMRVDFGDWIIHGIKGEVYPIKGRHLRRQLRGDTSDARGIHRFYVDGLTG